MFFSAMTWVCLCLAVLSSFLGVSAAVPCTFVVMAILARIEGRLEKVQESLKEK